MYIHSSSRCNTVTQAMRRCHAAAAHEVTELTRQDISRFLGLFCANFE